MIIIDDSIKQINSATKPLRLKDAQNKEIQCIKLSEPLSLSDFVAKKNTYQHTIISYCFWFRGRNTRLSSKMKGNIPS